MTRIRKSTGPCIPSLFSAGIACRALVHGVVLAAILTVGSVMIGCATATVDRTQVRAQEGAPVAAKVDLLTIPATPGLPRFVVAVEPLQAAQGSGDDDKVGQGFSAQLVTALTRAANISVIDYRGLNDNGDGTYAIKNVQQGELGPFIITGTITEFSEMAEGTSKKTGGSLGESISLLGGIGGMVGGMEGNMGMAAVGAVAAANPTIEKSTMTRTGMVAFDVQLLDGRTGRIVGSYPCIGNYKATTAQSATTVFGYGVQSEDFAQSALGQAMRVAMNLALRQIYNGLCSAPR